MAQATKELTTALKGNMLSALEGSTVQELEKLDKIFNQTAVTYKESRNDDLHITIGFLRYEVNTQDQS